MISRTGNKDVAGHRSSFSSRCNSSLPSCDVSELQPVQRWDASRNIDETDLADQLNLMERQIISGPCAHLREYASIIVMPPFLEKIVTCNGQLYWP